MQAFRMLSPLMALVVLTTCCVCLLAGVQQADAADAAYGNDVARDFNAKRIIALLRRNSRQPNALADSCKLYGHSCLGGHGKRSSAGAGGAEEVEDEGAAYRFEDDWLRSRNL